MNRRTIARAVPVLLVVSLVLTGCCNENWKGVGEVSGTLTITGIWTIGDIDAITVQTIDGCDNKYVHFSARDDDLADLRDELLSSGTFTTDLDMQEVIAGSTISRFMVRPTDTFRSAFEVRWSSEFKLKKDGSQVLTITYDFPEPDAH